MTRMMASTLCLLTTLLVLGLSTASADEPPICRSTDGRLYATAEQVRRCLRDEATAARVTEALAVSESATARANAEAGRAAELRLLLEQERERADALLLEQIELVRRVDQLERRPGFVWGAVAGGGAGVALTILVAVLATR